MLGSGRVWSWRGNPRLKAGSTHVCSLTAMPTCRFRDQSLTELLESVYGMMGYSFIAALREGLSSASSWETAEGALYCMWAVRQAARDRALKAKPDAQQTSQQTNEVGFWFTSCCSMGRLCCTKQIYPHHSQFCLQL
jgi:hypothetical protein